MCSISYLDEKEKWWPPQLTVKILKLVLDSLQVTKALTMYTATIFIPLACVASIQTFVSVRFTATFGYSQ